MHLLGGVADSESAHHNARSFLQGTSFDIASTALMAKQGYMNAQGTGRSLAETEFETLNVKAAQLVQEVIIKLQDLGRAAA